MEKGEILLERERASDIEGKRRREKGRQFVRKRERESERVY